MKVSQVALVSMLAGIGVALFAAAVDAPVRPESERRAGFQKAMKDGNFKDAYDGFRTLATSADTGAKQVGSDLVNGIQCLQRLGRNNEVDEFLETSVKAQPENWRLLLTAARQYLSIEHYGFQIAGEFRRGRHRGGGTMVSSLQRDRVRALQLLASGIRPARQDDRKSEVADFFFALADAMLYNRGYSEAWRFQYLTDLSELPDFEPGYPYFRAPDGAPVDEDGKPVFHHVPKSWDEAKTDGERWRWALEQVVENSASQLNNVRWRLAQFYYQQFGVQTMAQYRGFYRLFGGPAADADGDGDADADDDGDGDGDGDDGKKDESGTYDLHTIGRDETIARLATGVKRFTMPDEFNFVEIFQRIADDPKTGYGQEALDTLAQIFENRRQYPRAAQYWRQSIKAYGPGRNNYKKQRLSQIVDPWGAFEGIMTQPADQGATVEYRFRNGNRVDLEAHAIHVGQLLDDVKASLKKNPQDLDWQTTNLGNIGWRLVHNNEAKYVGEEVASWKLDLKPHENHFDRRITVNTPLQKAGAYLLTAKMADGNTSKIVVWISDTAIVQKPLSEKTFYFVADAVSGKPVAGANLEFFGWHRRHVRNTRRYNIKIRQFAETTGDDGVAIVPSTDLTPGYSWLIIARKGDRFAYLGFAGVWSGRYRDADYKVAKIYCITDRPVYRPKQKVHFKFWVRRAQYDQEDTSQFANRTFAVDIYNPKNEKIDTQKHKTDAYGGFEGELELPEDATLGVYRLQVEFRDKGNRRVRGGNSFRVEEYKKPEFQVTVEGPDAPVMLGEKITAKIKAKYYFGSPVTEATVKYKITRTEHSDSWYPAARWDWFYGPGYWWYGYDYPWYPGWHQWVGCLRPIPWWWHRGHNPPEVVAQREVKIGQDGTVDVEIDTELAKLIHGDSDHKYTITAEVRDQSRRTIVGQGNVLVARKPFKVFTWVDRGYYRVGGVIRANFNAHTLDKKPVRGKGIATLLKITYGDDRKPIETPVRRWQIDTDAQGTAKLQIRASAKGQYRLSYKLADAAAHTIEGGYLFTIMGEGFDGADYRFNSIELIPERREYKPGESVKLQVNTDRANGTVLLFVRPSNGVYLAPKILHLNGKSTVEAIEVVKKDMPNFFVEAITIADAKVYTETKEIIVPPEKRVLDVAIEPSQDEYLPGEKATVKVTLTDITGEPFVGSTVISIYDKSVEYISGGSNVPDIKEFFWKWRRRHNENTQTSLRRYFNNLTLPNRPGMSFLGVFGSTVADESDKLLGQGVEESMLLRRKSGGFGGGGLAMAGGRGVMVQKAGAPMADLEMSAAEGESMAMDGIVAAPANRAARFDQNGAGAGQEPLVQPTVRSNFADTALWVGSLTTDKTGVARVELDMPENLTAWKISVWGMGHGTKVGSATREVVTRKNLILRLQAPRFFVQKDEVVLSANVHNYLKTAKTATVVLELPGSQLEAIGQLTQQVTIPAGGEKRVDWRVKVLDEGTATVRMKALTDEESDATELKLPCYVHGMLKMEAWAGTVRPEDQSAQVTFRVPAERRVAQTVLEVRYSPTLAAAMVDALPYLAGYPYGCTEQTLNRFLPSVITQQTLIDMNLDLEAIGKKRTNLNAQEIGDDRERAKQWKRFDRNPVFDRAELDRMVKDGLKRLYMMQNGDGGWGWFSGSRERSWPHTTAVVVHGLQVARHNGVALVPGVLERGVAWLERYQAGQIQWLKNFDAKKKDTRRKSHADNLDAFVYMVLADAEKENATMRDYLYRDRNHLSVYAKSMFGLALHTQKQQQKLDMILENVRQYVVHDEENETAYLRLPEGSYWWYWYGSEVEANAYYLKLLSRVDAGGKTAPRLVKYLLNNRKHSTYWNSTRDTALCVEAFADYLKASGEMKPDMTIELWLDGEKKKEVAVNGENLFTFDNKLVLTGDAVADGEHKIEIRRRGTGPVYFNAYLTNFTLEDQITAAGLEIKVHRKYFKLVPVEKTVKVAGSRGQAVDQRVEKFERHELKNLDTLKSGELVEIELEIDSKNDYEYIMFEDMKAAGFEPVDLRSGYSRNGLGAYMELRDNRVAFFVRSLARGKHSIAYRMRAEIPGRFSALPTRAAAMYAPELRANSDEIKLKIED